MAIDTLTRVSRRGRVSLAALSFLIVALGWGAHAVTRGSGESAEEGAPATSSAPSFFCPMHPSYRARVAGDCPICNMRMTPRAASAAEETPVEGHARLELPPANVARIGVRTETVAPRPCTRNLRVSAHVEIDQRGLSAVSLKTGGWVEDLLARVEGEAIAPGQTLFTLYSPELYEAQRKYILASSLLAQTLAANGEEQEAAKRQRIEAARARLLLWDMSDEQIAALEAPGAEPLRTTPILARAGGVVLARHIVQGTRVEPGESLFELADLARVWVIAEVPEAEFGAVALGARATVEVPSAPGKTFEGRVTFIHPTLDEATRTARVRIELENAERALMPGMYATATLALDLGVQLLIDDEAVLDTGLRQLVFVELAPGEYEPRAVTLGERQDGLARVLEGLEEGERVVTRGVFLLDSESRLRAALAEKSGP
jgi:Cu(I)/Ag(I) efflux system membrane fusion protein